MMKDTLKMAGSLVLIALLIAHFFLIAFLLAPTNRLLGMILEESSGLISATDIPEDVSRFLTEYNIGGQLAHFPRPDSRKDRLVISLLELRQTRFMSEKERLALRANQLDYGQGVRGISEASEFYYEKPLAQLEDRQWITLFNLYEIQGLK